MKKISNVVWGLCLIALGVIWGLNALEIANINVFFKGWWTLFIIVPCFIGILNNEKKTSDIIGLLVGLALLLACQDIIGFGTIFKLLLPTILVIIGLSIIFKDNLNEKVKKEIKKLNKNNDKEYCVTFGEQDIDFNGETFTGCNLDAIFGGVKCDLRDSKIKEDVVINACSVFGGIKIFVPSDVNVKISSTSIFGGVTNNVRKRKDDQKVTIYINASCIFGGVEIK